MKARGELPNPLLSALHIGLFCFLCMYKIKKKVAWNVHGTRAQDPNFCCLFP